MSRDNIPAATAAELSRPQLAPIGLVDLDCASGHFRMWTGFGELQWRGYTWHGAGTLGAIGAMEETTETRAAGVELTLSGIPAEVLQIANGENWQGRDARIYYAVLDDQGRFVGEPFQIRRGLMDAMSLKDGAECAISLTIESRDIDLRRARIRRYTAEDQRAEHPGDAGMDGITAVQSWDGKWNES